MPWTESLLLSAIILALLLRVFNLANLFPAVDEYYHLIAAKQIVEGAALSSVYQRSLWVVTLPVSFAMRIFGNQLWAARMVGSPVQCAGDRTALFSNAENKPPDCGAVVPAVCDQPMDHYLCASCA